LKLLFDSWICEKRRGEVEAPIRRKKIREVEAPIRRKKIKGG